MRTLLETTLLTNFSDGWFKLLRQRLAVLFRPGAISRHCLQWWAALSPAGARPFGLGFGHAGAGLCFQARTDVNQILLALRTGWGLILRVARRRDTGQQQ
jgi:hypothetical protein